jgi:hypothetical protein
MGYSRPHIRQAAAAAREAGHVVDGFAGDREMVLQLERWGFLPIDQDAVDQRIADWYVSQGLAVRADTPDTPEPDTPDATPERSRVALEAAEAALAAAAAALRLARLSA